MLKNHLNIKNTIMSNNLEEKIKLGHEEYIKNLLRDKLTTHIKDIKEMTLEELRQEMSELWAYLYMTREIGTYDKFSWNGLNYCDAVIRDQNITKEFLSQEMKNCEKLYNELLLKRRDEGYV